MTVIDDIDAGMAEREAEREARCEAELERRRRGRSNVTTRWPFMDVRAPWEDIIGWGVDLDCTQGAEHVEMLAAAKRWASHRSDVARVQDIALAAGEQFEKLLDAGNAGECVDPDELAFWLGTYHGAWDGFGADADLCQYERVLADFLWEIARSPIEGSTLSSPLLGSDGDMARRLVAALAAAGFAIVATR